MIGDFQAAPFCETRIVPFVSVRNGAKAIEFYEVALRAVVEFRHQDPSGSSVVARLSVDGVPFWLSDESPEYKNFSPETLGGSTTRMILMVNDPDAVFARAVKAGAQIIWTVREEYGWRIGRFVDPFGHHWEVGKPLSKDY